MLNHAYLREWLNSFKIPSNIQIIPFEKNLRNKKGLVASIYKVPLIRIIIILFERQNLKKLWKTNFKPYDSDEFKLDIFNSISAMRTYAAFEYNILSILDIRLKGKENMSKNLSDIVKFKWQRK